MGRAVSKSKLDGRCHGFELRLAEPHIRHACGIGSLLARPAALEIVSDDRRKPGEVTWAGFRPRLQSSFLSQVGKAPQHLVLSGSLRSVHYVHDMTRSGVDLFIVGPGHHVQSQHLAQPGVLFAS